MSAVVASLQAENSSQALCLSAFGSLRHPTFDNVRSGLESDFVAGAFPVMRTTRKPRRWSIGVEVEDPDLLGEHGGRTQPTSIDALFTSTRDVVAMEAKFDSDAQAGFGECSQPKAKHCSGFYSADSDLKRGTSALCRLENWDGTRSLRLYWAWGKRFFQPSVFQLGKKRPFAEHHYQLMRNFLFAAALAEREDKNQFALLVVCPRGRDTAPNQQLEAFKAEVLQEAFRGHVALRHYEDWIELLSAITTPETLESRGVLGTTHFKRPARKPEPAHWVKSGIRPTPYQMRSARRGR
jgi:hypothetical protein